MKFLDETGLKFIATKFKELRESLANKVDKVAGKDLSTNDYTNEAKAKVDAIPENPKYTDTVIKVADNLTTDFDTYALSANQGKVLGDAVFGRGLEYAAYYLKRTGFYYVTLSSEDNFPQPWNVNGNLIVKGLNNNFVQFFIPNGSDDIYKRKLKDSSNNTWSKWEKIATSNNAVMKSDVVQKIDGIEAISGDEQKVASVSAVKKRLDGLVTVIRDTREILGETIDKLKATNDMIEKLRKNQPETRKIGNLTYSKVGNLVTVTGYVQGNYSFNTLVETMPYKINEEMIVAAYPSYDPRPVFLKIANYDIRYTSQQSINGRLSLNFSFIPESAYV